MADENAASQRTVLGRSKIFTPEVIDDIHMKAELGRYRMRGFSMFKKIPHWDELIFLPGTLTRFVIEGYREKCVTKTVLGARFAKKPIELDIPVYITGMSFGALSIEAKMALAKGASMAGTATCSGEGGMIPPERDLSTKWYYQIIQSRYGFNPHHLMLADAVEFFIGQGCKVGLGGHLMGQKVTEQVAEMRSLPAGIDQRSPARHPDWLGPDDLSLKVQETREATNYEIPIQLKLGAARVYDDVRMAAKCGPDIIYLDGAEGGDRARPRFPAGLGVQLSGRMLFDFKGAIFWRMQAGMGEVIFAPVYEALARRGVEFRFFSPAHQPGSRGRALGGDHRAHPAGRPGPRPQPLRAPDPGRRAALLARASARRPAGRRPRRRPRVALGPGRGNRDGDPRGRRGLRRRRAGRLRSGWCRTSPPSWSRPTRPGDSWSTGPPPWRRGRPSCGSTPARPSWGGPAPPA